MTGGIVAMAYGRSRLSFFMDINALKVMLELYRDNPDVSFGALLKTTAINKVELSSLLEEMISAELVRLKAVSEKEENLFTLRDEARMSLNRLNVREKIES